MTSHIHVPDPTTSHAYLVRLKNEVLQQEVYTLIKNQITTIGRAPTNKIVVQDDMCSRNHCEIFHDGHENWCLRDLSSRNGTYVDNQKVSGDYPLGHQDFVSVGDCEFQFLLVLPQDDLEGKTPRDPNTETSDIGDINAQLKERDKKKELPRILQRRRENRYKQMQARDGEHIDSLSRELGRLYKLALQMGLAENVRDLCKVILEHLLDATSADIGAILLPDQTIPIPVAKHFQTELFLSKNTRQEYRSVSSSLTNMVLELKEGFIAEDISDFEVLKDRDSLNRLQAEGVLCAPILTTSKVVGIIHLYSTNPSNQLDDDDLNYTMAVADQMVAVLEKLSEREKLQTGLEQVNKQNRSLKKQLEIETELVGNSTGFHQVTRQIAKIAPTDAAVLIRGESGVGKELVARAIHVNSKRSDEAYICMNCAALSESLLESELFGHEKGSFTGATGRKSGKFEQAHHGTLFLDEIGEMSPSIQAKFLRVLEGHPFERVGGSESIKTDVRVVAATNRDLEIAVEEGKFRKDLYFRLNVIEIIVPALRERQQDIQLIAEHFIDRIAAKTGRIIKKLDAAAQQKLLEYSWPGNVRELKNVVERAYLMSDEDQITTDDIRLSSLLADISTSHKSIATTIAAFSPKPLEQLEIEHILATLEYTEWNKSHASQMLGIERSTLDRKLKRHGVNRPD